jgi:dihydroorotase
MSKLLHLGLPLDDVVRMATSSPASSLGALAGSAGRLVVGGDADVAVLALVEEPRELKDSLGVGRVVGRHLEPVAVVRAGVEVPVRPRVTVPPAGISPG